jgi:hypothetical protein
MPRTYGLRTSRDLLAKLERDAELLRKEVTSDHFFNFVVTAYSLADWIKNDPSVSQVAKDALDLFRSSRTIQICRDLANASKHFTLDPRRNPNPRVDSVTSEQGFGMGRFGHGGFGIGEEEIHVVLEDGSVQNGLTIMENTLQEWLGFFSQYSL